MATGRSRWGRCGASWVLLLALLETACTTAGTPDDTARGGQPLAAPIRQTSGDVRFEPPEVDFNTVAEGLCRSRKLVVVNQSGGSLTPGFELGGSPAFTIQKGFRDCPDPLGDGESCRIYLNFCAGFSEIYRGTLTFVPTGDAINLTGRGRIRKF